MQKVEGSNPFIRLEEPRKSADWRFPGRPRTIPAPR
jgi:hypothetical protein